MLKRLLAQGRDDDIRADPALMREAAAALPALKVDATRRASERDVAAIIARLFPVYHQPERTDAEWAAWWGLYFDALTDLPLVQVRAAVAAWAKTPAEFLAKPGEFRELALRTPSPEGEAHARLSRIAGHLADPLARAERREPTAEEREAVRRMVAGFKPKAVDQPNAPPPLPPIHGKTDERGVTPEMRALLARQQERRP